MKSLSRRREKYVRRVVLLVMYLIPFYLCSQSSHYSITNYTVEDGLPSNECHDIIQDSLGYIWIATDRGLSRFDGYEFKNYTINEGLKDISCLNIQLDVEGNIWINTLSKRILKYLFIEDTIVPYMYLDSLMSYMKHMHRINEFYIDSELNFHCNILGSGLVTISESGEVHFERLKGEFRFYSPSFIDNYGFTLNNYLDSNNNLMPHYPNNRIIHPIVGPIDRPSIYFKDKYILPKVNSNVRHGNNVSTPETFDIGKDLGLFTLFNIAYIFDEVEFGEPFEFNHISDVHYDDNRIITTSYLDHEVRIFKTIDGLKSGDFEVILGGNKYSRILVDKYEGLWITTLDKGVFHLTPNKGNSSLIDFTANKSILAIESNQIDQIYFNENKQNVICYTKKNGVSPKALDLKGEFYELDFIPTTNELVICGSNSAVINLEDNQISYMAQDNDQDNSQMNLNTKSIIFHPKKEYLFLSPHYTTTYDNLYELPSWTTYDPTNQLRIIDAIDFGDIFMISKVDGLYTMDRNEISGIQNVSPLFTYRANTFSKFNEEYLIGTSGAGLVFWDGDSKVFSIDKEDGLLSNIIENIFVDSKNRILCSTYAGVSILDYVDQDSFSISNYTSFHGLPSNQVFDVTELQGKYYVATATGIGIIEGEKELASTVQPIIEEIVFNENSYKYNDSIPELWHYENDLSVDYVTLDFNQSGKVPYRYRLNDGDWTITKSTNALYPDLHPGDYTFELCSENIDGIWSEPTSFKFHICYPWYEQWYFNQGLIILALLLFYLFYKYRINKTKKENEVKEEIRELEKAALQAQMNPHFIFNCLNSIQGFIMNNDKEQAMSYLSKFANLIRSNLNASVEDKITLSQEVQMLDNYLQLEQLRFSKRFEYNIVVAENLDILVTKLSPLLVQPFVENAVIHGVKNTNGKGKIDVHFSRVEDKLEVLIKDNGKGINSIESHKNNSLGMNITQKRLAFINNQDQDKFQLDVKSSDEGTEVRIRVPIV